MEDAWNTRDPHRVALRWDQPSWHSRSVELDGTLWAASKEIRSRRADQIVAEPWYMNASRVSAPSCSRSRSHRGRTRQSGSGHLSCGRGDNQKYRSDLPPNGPHLE